MHIQSWIKQPRLHRSIYFVEVLVGYWMSTGTLDWSLAAVFVSFNIFLYSGIYTMNDLFDLRHDRAHPRKKNRPIASGNIPEHHAKIFAAVMILIGLAIGYALGMNVFLFELAFVALNAAYSFVLKHIPYVEFLTNAATHVLRVIFGMALGGAVVYPIVLIGIFSTIVGFTLVKREHELVKKEIQGRPALRWYTRAKIKILYFAAIFVLLVCTYFAEGFAQLALGILLIFYIIALPILRKKFRQIS